jgi:ParB-like chromosome segregation protein Spo0J
MSHPLDEGEAYRRLIEESKYDYASVAAKVGKSESYVKQRLFLTNLEARPASAYRSGKILDGHAALIAKLSAGDQLLALKATTERYSLLTVKELKEWIESHIYSPLDEQPWLKDSEAMGLSANASNSSLSVHRSSAR